MFLSHGFILGPSLSKGHFDFSNIVGGSLPQILSPRPVLLLTEGIILRERGLGDAQQPRRAAFGTHRPGARGRSQARIVSS